MKQVRDSTQLLWKMNELIKLGYLIGNIKYRLMKYFKWFFFFFYLIRVCIINFKPAVEILSKRPIIPGWSDTEKIVISDENSVQAQEKLLMPCLWMK